MRAPNACIQCCVPVTHHLHTSLPVPPRMRHEAAPPHAALAALARRPAGVLLLSSLTRYLLPPPAFASAPPALPRLFPAGHCPHLGQRDQDSGVQCGAQPVCGAHQGLAGPGHALWWVDGCLLDGWRVNAWLGGWWVVGGRLNRVGGWAVQRTKTGSDRLMDARPQHPSPLPTPLHTPHLPLTCLLAPASWPPASCCLPLLQWATASWVNTAPLAPSSRSSACTLRCGRCSSRRS